MAISVVSGVPLRRLTVYVVAGFLVGTVLMGAVWNVYLPYPESGGFQAFPSSLERFTSYEQMKVFLEDVPQGNWYYGGAVKGRGFLPMMVAESTNAASSAADSAALGGSDYSVTNIQVAGVDEADIVKTDGAYIYLVSEDRVHIVRAFPPEDAALVSTIELSEWIVNIYVSEDKLVVFELEDPYYIRPWPMPEDLRGEVTTVKVFDVSDRAEPVLEREITLDGFLVDSRMIGDYVYIVTQRHSWLYNETEVWLPRFKSGEAIQEVEADMIYYSNVTEGGCSFTNVVAINSQDPDEPMTHETLLLNSASTIYASTGSIYISSPWWDSENGEITKIYKLTVEGKRIQYTADGAVPGNVLNQFSMDEYEDHFRIATTAGRVSRSGGDTSNNVYVLNSSLNIVGHLEDLAPGERIHSARFMGGRCYLVTFKKVDPLFTIDLNDPENPFVLGKLKIPGYSDYLHPYDEDHLIGIGKETVEAEEGDFAWYQGVKISLFDVSDVENPRELSKLEIGDRGTDTPALYDHKAVLFSRSRNLLVIPILVAEIDESDYADDVLANAYGEYVYQGAHVFHVSPEEGIRLRGVVSHIEGDEAFLKSGYYFDSELMVERSLYIDDVLYTLSSGMVKMNWLDDLAEVGSVELP